jgi:hypothetical protein
LAAGTLRPITQPAHDLDFFAYLRVAQIAAHRRGNFQCAQFASARVRRASFDRRCLGFPMLCASGTFEFWRRRSLRTHVT